MKFDFYKGYELINKVLSEPATNGSPRKEFINKILQAFLDIGFENVRFYEVSYSAPHDDNILILSNFSGKQEQYYQIGYKIKYKDSTLGLSNSISNPVQDFALKPKISKAQKKWIDELYLKNSVWIDIPLNYVEKLVGVIAVDWEGNKNDIDEQNIILLRMFGSIIGARLELIPSELLEKARIEIHEATKTTDTIDEFLKNSIKTVCNLFNVSLASIFEFNWSKNKLVKIHETCNYVYKEKFNQYPEEYNIGEYLTGQAWEDGRYHYIPDFSSLEINDEQLVNKAAFNRHSSILGDITSTFYQQIGKREKRYLIRYMNRSDIPELPLLINQIVLLQKINIDIADFVDDKISESRLANLQKISKSFFEKLDSPNIPLNNITDSFSDEGFDNLVILTHTDDSIYFTNQIFIGKIFNDHNKKLKIWKEDKLYMKIIDSETPKVFDLRRIDDTPNHSISKFLIDKGTIYLLALSFYGLKTKGLLLVPLSHNHEIEYRPSISNLKKLQPGRFKILLTYSDLVGNLIEAMESSLTAEGAKKLVGHIGHEVNTPATSLAATAITTLWDISKKHTDDLNTYNFIVSKINEIKKEKRTMGKTMEIALMLAQQNQRLQVKFREENLSEIILKAARNVESTFTALDPNDKPRYFQINISDSCKKLPKTVCDRELLIQVFSNIFKNAAKYSLPRYSYERNMQIEVLGLPQSNMNIIQIKNWGIGILPDEFEKIFRPYYRVGLSDDKRAVRGMGLGLYVARTIISVHSGSVHCASSIPTLNNFRSSNLEGYLTTFEIRIPTNLKTGIYEHKIDNWS